MSTEAAQRGRLVEDLGPSRRATARWARHVAWATRDGLGRLVEEDGLDPRVRWRSARSARRWRRENPRPAGSARVALVVGVQRSGTNMVLRGIESDPAVEVRNENDRRVFRRYQLRDHAVVADAVARSRHDLVLLKPLCDSHRTAQLLELFGPRSRAVWIYRDVDGRAASAVAKFGDANRRVLTELAAGAGAGRWQLQGLSPASHELVRRCDPARLDPWSAAALFWCVRNRLVLEQGLDRRPDVLLLSYERVVADPEPEVSVLARFLGLAPDPALWSHVDARGVSTPRLDLDPRVRQACDELTEDLAVTVRRHLARLDRGGVA